MLVLLLGSGCSEAKPHESDPHQHPHSMALHEGSLFTVPQGHRAGIMLQTHAHKPCSIEPTTTRSPVVPNTAWSETKDGILYSVILIDNNTSSSIDFMFRGSPIAASLERVVFDPDVPPIVQHRVNPDESVGRTREALRSDLLALGVRPRETWNATTPTCSTPETSKENITIHHTAGNGMGDVAMIIKQIQMFHITANGWCDIGYHFLVSSDGAIWEGRALETLGAHVSSNNARNIGISFLGCFDEEASCEPLFPKVPTTVSLEKTQALVATLSDIFSIPLNPTHLKGHRDFSSAATTCPGDALHANLDFFRRPFPTDSGLLVDSGLLRDANTTDAETPTNNPGTLSLCRCGLWGAQRPVPASVFMILSLILACIFRR